MRDIKEVQEALSRYKELYLNSRKEFKDDYSWGICNGIEIALALVEDRPVFYIDKEKQHNKKDLKEYPEYFL